MPPMFLSVLTVLASTFLFASARASVVISNSAEPPSQNMAMSLVVPDEGAAGYQWRNTPANGRRDLGQIFTPTEDFTLGQLTVQLQSGSGYGTKAAPFTLLFFEVNGKKISRTLVTAVGQFPAEVFPANSFLSFDLSGDNLPLKAGVTYGFLLIFDEPAESRALSLQSLNSNSEQPGVHRVESADGSELSITKAALEFYLQAADPSK